MHDIQPGSLQPPASHCPLASLYWGDQVLGFLKLSHRPCLLPNTQVFTFTLWPAAKLNNLLPLLGGRCWTPQQMQSIQTGKRLQFLLHHHQQPHHQTMRFWRMPAHCANKQLWCPLCPTKNDQVLPKGQADLFTICMPAAALTPSTSWKPRARKTLAFLHLLDTFFAFGSHYLLFTRPTCLVWLSNL